MKCMFILSISVKSQGISAYFVPLVSGHWKFKYMENKDTVLQFHIMNNRHQEKKHWVEKYFLVLKLL